MEDSAFGYIKMEDGAAIFLEASWALNVLESKEAATTLCGTKAGAQINAGMSYPASELIYVKTNHGMLTEEKNSPAGNIAYFDGKEGKPEVLEAKQWLEAVIHDKEPLVKPEQAFIVTKILDAIYRSAAEGKEITFKNM